MSRDPRRGTRGCIAIAICVAFLPLIPLEPATAAADVASSGAATRPRIPHSPIEHVVIVFQENHSFDNVLGVLCVRTQRCDGATTGLLPNGKSIRLRRSPDIIPQVSHDAISQGVAIDQGKMDGFANIHGCSKSGPIPRDCYTQFGPSQIPNLATLAGQFVVSDRTFEPGPVPSWGAHVHLAAATLDGFAGETDASTYTSQTGPGSGCDSYKDALWTDPASGEQLYVPACIPDQNGFGPYRASPVPWVPTIMDRLGDAGLSWRIYAPPKGRDDNNNPYGWSICPTFADCLYTSEHDQVVEAGQILVDAAQGTLPSFSILLPNGVGGNTSQHNQTSMALGDNWIGQVVGAIEGSTNWASTAIFITYDDCGCFYDHVPPPTHDWGIRVPMVIVSPFAKPAYTDSTPATFASMLAFTEHAFGLGALANADARAYDYRDSFDYAQPPTPPVAMTTTPVPRWELRYIAAHPVDADDPT